MIETLHKEREVFNTCIKLFLVFAYFIHLVHPNNTTCIEIIFL